MFKGFRTYLCALAIGLVVVCQYLGYLDAKTVEILLGLLGASGLAALRAAVGK